MKHGARGPATRRPTRVLLCKPGLDGHDRGVKIIARVLRDAGMEVIYVGMRVTPSEIAHAAVQEDVDVVGVSNHSAALPELCEEVIRALSERQAGDIPVVAGGTVLEEDLAKLKELGVAAVFGPGTDTDQIAEMIRTLARGFSEGNFDQSAEAERANGVES